MHRETRLQSLAHDIGRTHVGLLLDAVGHDRAIDARNHCRGHRIIGADHRESVERQVVQEIDEALLEALEIAFVRAEMIVVDVGDDGDHRLQMHERRIALVRLSHEISALTQSRVRIGAHESTADDERRIEIAFGQQARDHAGRRGLAMRAGDSDGIAEAHQLTEHLGALHDRQAARRRHDHFRDCSARSPSRRRPRRHRRRSRPRDRSSRARRAFPGAP